MTPPATTVRDPGNAVSRFVTIGEETERERGPRPRFTAKELVQAVTARFAVLPGSVLPNDHCFNWTNVGVRAEHAPVFLREGTGPRAEGFVYVGLHPRLPADLPVHHRPATGPLAGTPVRVRGRLDLTPVDAAEPLPEEVDAAEHREGRAVRVFVNAYERSGRARAACIARARAAHPEGKPACAVCGDAMGDLYGEEVEALVHVHHLRPLAERGEDHRVDPARDLVCVCPNCHAVIHHGGAVRGVEEVRAMRERQRR